MTGKRLAITTGAIALLVIGVAAFVARDRIAEEWWIYRLGSKDDATKIHAAEKLASIKSLAAVPHLLQIIESERRELFGNFGGGRGSTYRSGVFFTPLSHCLYMIGPNAKDSIEVWTKINNKRIEDEIKRNVSHRRKGAGADMVIYFIERAWAEKSKVERREYHEF